MAGNDRASREAWVKRVLNVQIPEIRAGTVNYAKLLLEWRSAQQRASASLSAFGSAILALDEVQDDPRFARVAAVVKTLPNLVPTFGDELADHLDSAMTAGHGDAGKSHLRDALKTIGAYRQRLAEVPALVPLANLAKRSVGFDLTAHRELETALATLEQQVSARVG